jgi:hypothetical protein
MEKNMTSSKTILIATKCLVVACLLVIGTLPGFARERDETIDAQAMGTGSQMGESIGVTLNISEYSTPADRVILLQAFNTGKNQGLVNALQKMRAVGHVAITGTLGYDCSYIKMTPTPTERKIIFVTNRRITFAENWADSQSLSFDLTAGELDINDQDKSKSTGVLYPAAQLVVDKTGQIQVDLNQNAWTLIDLIDWKGTAGVN